MRSREVTVGDRYEHEWGDERFWRKVDRSGECWLWTGSTANGYGHLRRNRSYIRAHRYAFEQAKGPIPEGMFVCHRCDVPRCVNPDHLFLGTAADNNLDMRMKDRGNPRTVLTPAQVVEILSSSLPNRQVAQMFSVSEGTVRLIRRRRIWPKVEVDHVATVVRPAPVVRTCGTPGCGKKHLAMGLCGMHWAREKRRKGKSNA